MTLAQRPSSGWPRSRPPGRSSGVSALLESRGLAAGYGGEPVLRDVEFSADAGDVVVVLGPNGGGKTTLF